MIIIDCIGLALENHQIEWKTARSSEIIKLKHFAKMYIYMLNDVQL